MSEQHGTTHMEWTTPEFPVHTRGRWWYFWTTLVGGALVLIALATENYLFALVVILVAILTALYEYRGPRDVHIRITDRGIVHGKDFLPFASMRDFRIAYDPPHVQRLYISFAQWYRTQLSLPLDNQDPTEVRAALAEYLEEDIENEGEAFHDTVARRFKL